MADDRDSLLREVEEELRREQMQKLWAKYNGVIIGGLLLILVAVGGYKYHEGRQLSQAQSGGAEFAAAESLADDKKKADAEKAFSTIAKDGPPGYSALARLNLAGDAVKAGKTDEAIAQFDDLAAHTSDHLLKSFAQLQSASLRMAKADYADIQNRLTPLAADGAPFRSSAQELLGLAAYKAGKFDDARKFLEPLLIDPNASEQIQERVKIVLAAIATAETGGSGARPMPQPPAPVAPVGTTLDTSGKPTAPPNLPEPKASEATPPAPAAATPAPAAATPAPAAAKPEAGTAPAPSGAAVTTPAAVPADKPAETPAEKK